MAITVEVKPDLSAFREASVDELATQLCDDLNRLVGERGGPGAHAPLITYADCKLAAAVLLERHWIVPK